MTFQVGGYRALRLIGPGSTARVWRAEPDSGGQPVVLSIYEAAQRAQLHREFELAGSLRHPHLLQVLDIAESSTQLALITALADGGSLRERLLAGPLRAGQTVTVLAGIAAGLAMCHQRGTVHGNISPSNILLAADGRPLLAGIGAAQAAFEAGAKVPTNPPYVSPEVARGSRPVPADDIFALGSVAMHCLTGAPAWPAENLRDVIIQSAYGRWPTPDPNTPESLNEVVRRMIDEEPADRPLAAEVIERLRGCGVLPEALERTADFRSDSESSPESPGDTAAAGPIEGPPGNADSWLGSPPTWSVGAAPSAATATGQSAPGASVGRTRRVPSQRSGLLRLLVTLLASMLVAAGAVAGGLWWAGLDSAAAPAVADPTADWSALIQRLDQRRSDAFRAGDPSILAQVYTPEAAGLLVDTARINDLRAAGYRVDGLAHQIRSVQAQLIESDTAVLTVVDSLPAYPIRAADGTVVGQTAIAPESTRTITLTKVGAEFRIVRVLATG